MTSSMISIDSGHGGQTEDLDGDEEDGYDEGKLIQHLSKLDLTPFLGSHISCGLQDDIPYC